MEKNYATTLLALQISKRMDAGNARLKSQQQFRLHQLQHQQAPNKNPVAISPTGVKIFYALAVLLMCLIMKSAFHL